MPAIASTGGLYALMDTSDAWHLPAAQALEAAGGPLVVVAPALSEAMRLGRRFLGQEASLCLLDAVLAGELLFQPLHRQDLPQARRWLQEQSDLAPSSALALAAGRRLGVEGVICTEPASRRLAGLLGFRVLPTAPGES